MVQVPVLLEWWRARRGRGVKASPIAALGATHVKLSWYRDQVEGQASYRLMDPAPSYALSDLEVQIAKMHDTLARHRELMDRLDAKTQEFEKPERKLRGWQET